MVRVHPGLLTEASRRRQPAVLLCLPEAQAGHTGPRRGVGRPRHPVTVEIVGSNPIEDALQREGHGTQIGKAAKLKPS
jgi:hypothetical protein